MKLEFSIYKSPLGNLYIVSDTKFLKAIIFKKNWTNFRKNKVLINNPLNPILKKTKKQLSEYFLAKRKKFSIKAKPEGTKFQINVWNSLKKIPYANTKSYKEQGALFGRAKAARAIGAANAKNPISIIYPCHRVIAANFEIHGYSGGVKAKKFLLSLEGVELAS